MNQNFKIKINIKKKFKKSNSKYKMNLVKLCNNLEFVNIKVRMVNKNVDNVRECVFKGKIMKVYVIVLLIINVVNYVWLMNVRY